MAETGWPCTSGSSVSLLWALERLPPSSTSRTLTFALRTCAACACRFPSASGCARGVRARWRVRAPQCALGAHSCQDLPLAENVLLRDLNPDAPVLDDRGREPGVRCQPLGLARPLGRRCRWAAALGQ